MKISGTEAEIIDIICADHPEAMFVVDIAHHIIPFSKRQIMNFEAVVLYGLTKHYNFNDSSILEIGTALGFSCCIMALAAPKSTIITLNPKKAERINAIDYLSRFPNVILFDNTSQEFLKDLNSGHHFDMVFIDGGHKESDIDNDIQFYNHLKHNGLILFHDYCREGSKRQCPSVFNALNKHRQQMGKEFDVYIMADTGIGMVGWMKK